MEIETHSMGAQSIGKNEETPRPVLALRLHDCLND